MIEQETVTQAPNTEQPAAQPQEQPAEPESLRDSIRGLVNDDGTLNREAIAKSEPDRAQTEEEKAGPERGPDGKFVSSDTEKQKEGAAKASDTDKKDTEPEKGKEPDKGKEEAAKDGKETEARKDGNVRPPAGMSAKDHEAFYKLPSDQQQWLVEREKALESGASRKINEYAEKAKAIEPLERVLAPHREKFAHMGASPEQVVSQLLTLADHADRDFPGFVREQARLRGIPLDAFGQQQTGEEGQRGHEPEIQALRQQVAQLQQVLKQDYQTRETATLQSMAQAVNDFAQDSEYPYYADLETEMVPFVAALRHGNPDLQPRDILARAYKAALANNPEVSAKLDADRRAEEDRARLQRQREETAKALRSADGNITGNAVLPPGDGLSDDPGNMRNYILQEARRLSA